MAYLPYEAPGITTILSLASFIILLNVVRYVLDRLLYCGIIGEIVVGIIWGLPLGGTAWLTLDMQNTIQSLGYLGLIGLVYEGGLVTDLAMLRKGAVLSIFIATIGILVPIALSFLLLVIPFPSGSGTAYPTSLAAFSAGASLCSTSLGTTFAILSSAGLQHTRMGVVLVGAAMMDDIVGLVMVNIITTLGAGNIEAWPIARPIVSSFALLLITLVVCHFIFRPVYRWFLPSEVDSVSEHNKRESINRRVRRSLGSTLHISFAIYTVVLAVFITIASFVDASVLFASFIAGCVISFVSKSAPLPNENNETTPSVTYDRYYKAAMDTVLVPFFFASIGFAIPIKNMFRGSIVWRGVIYAILMIIAKGVVSIAIYIEYARSVWKAKRSVVRDRSARSQGSTASHEATSSLPADPTPPHVMALLVGCAMIARGEIGFLIASLSQSSGTLLLRNQGTSANGEDVFLVITWAIVICTIVGPVGVGLTVRRLNRTP